MVVGSLLLGALTHLFWDGFTHDPAGHGWAVGPIPALGGLGPGGVEWWHLAQWASSALGGAMAVACFWWIGRTHALRRWHGASPIVAVRPVLFWTVVGAVFACCAASLPFLPYRLSAHVLGVRVLWALGAALIAGAVAVRLRAQATPTGPPRDDRRPSIVDG
jgi:hypothetical protein